MSEWENIRHIYAQKPIQLGLDRVVKVWDAFGGNRPHFVIAVAGTNGKGSCCFMLDGILRNAGYRVGLYTSPHLLTFRERINIDGKMVTEEILDTTFNRLAASKGSESLTQFEIDTLVAISIMNEANVDVSVLEVGLGGRLDAVNIFDADCAVVTSVDFDHMDYLGESREQIGFEKAGIFRGGRPAICGELDLPESISGYAKEIGADLYLIGHDFGYDTVDTNQWKFWSRSGQCMTLPYPALKGTNQLSNASVCLAALEQINTKLPVMQEDIRFGLLTATLPGRFQVIPGEPVVILDVGHNPHAIKCLAESLQTRFPERQVHAVFAVMRDKDIAGIINPMKSLVQRWYLAPIPLARTASEPELLALFHQIGVDNLEGGFAAATEAFAAAKRNANKDGLVLVFGTFPLVSEFLAHNS